MLSAEHRLGHGSLAHSGGGYQFFHIQVLLADVRHIIAHVFGAYEDWRTIGLEKDFSVQVNPVLCKRVLSPTSV